RRVRLSGPTLRPGAAERSPRGRADGPDATRAAGGGLGPSGPFEQAHCLRDGHLGEHGARTPPSRRGPPRRPYSRGADRRRPRPSPLPSRRGSARAESFLHEHAGLLGYLGALAVTAERGIARAVLAVLEVAGQPAQEAVVRAGLDRDVVPAEAGAEHP